MATPFEYIGLSLAVFGALAKLPNVVHTVRNVRAYDGAKKTKKSRASRLLKQVGEAEEAVEKLRLVRRSGRRLVPRPLIKDFHRLTRLCKAQARAYIDYIRKMHIDKDPTYRWKHAIMAALGLCNKQRRLSTALSDCEVWLIVAFYTINLYVLKHSWDAQRDVDVRLLEKLLSENLRLARRQRAESSHEESMRDFRKYKIKVDILGRDADTILNQSSSTLSDVNPWMRNPISGDVWGREYADTSHGESGHVHDTHSTFEPQPNLDGVAFTDCQQPYESRYEAYCPEYAEQSVNHGYTNHEQNGANSYNMPPPLTSDLQYNGNSTETAGPTLQQGVIHDEDMGQPTRASCRQTTDERTDIREGDYHDRPPGEAANEYHRQRRRRTRESSETTNSASGYGYDSYDEGLDHPRSTQMAASEQVLWNGNIYTPHPPAFKDNDSGYGGSMPPSPSQPHASPVQQPAACPEGDRRYPPRTPYTRRNIRSSSRGSRSSNGYQSS